MQVFISGAAGFLGSHLAEAYVAEGAHVVGCDNLIGGELSNLPEGIQFEQADCCDVSAMKRLMAGSDLVYHCAAIATEGLSVFSPALIAQHVYQNTAAMLVAAASNKIGRFVNCSSMARYGNAATPFTEETPPQPVDPYGISKFAAEMLVKDIAETHGFEYAIAVPHNIIGPKQKYDDPYRNVASIMINRMLKGEQPIIYGDGGQKRCFSFVQDCVDPLMKMGTRDGIAGEVINIGPDEEYISILELAGIIAELMNFTLDPIFVPERPREVRYATCSADKARRLLDYETKVSLRDGLRSIIEWIRANGTRPFQYHLPIEIDSPLVPNTWKQRMM